MSKNAGIHFGWMKFMYIYNAATAGLLGLAIILIPRSLIVFFRIPDQEPMVFGIIGSIYVSLGALSLLGFRSPLKFAPILLLQLLYKVVWIVAIIPLLAVTGQVSIFSILLTVIFFTYIIGDLIAIPFPYLFSKN